VLNDPHCAIGVFDSGVGGLSVWREIAALLPTAKRIDYNPAGFTVDWEGRHLWIRNLENLRVWLPRVNTMRGNDVAIYSWGVSIRR